MGAASFLIDMPAVHHHCEIARRLVDDIRRPFEDRAVVTGTHRPGDTAAFNKRIDFIAGELALDQTELVYG